MNNNFFDIPLPKGAADVTVSKLKEGNWKIDDTRWMGDQSEDFYKGMYAAVRVFGSMVANGMDKETLFNHVNRIGLDILFIIDKNKSKIIT